MKPFTEAMRYDYDDLTPESVVFDVGAYEGNWAREIERKVWCYVICFEPVFFRDLARSLSDYSKVIVIPFGLGNQTRKQQMCVKGDSTGQFAESGERVPVQIVDVCAMLDAYGPVSLMKLNCEGAEFEILERLLQRGRMGEIKNLAIQFHQIVPDFQTRWENIRKRLLVTHELTYDAPWCWEGYRIK